MEWYHQADIVGKVHVLEGRNISHNDILYTTEWCKNMYEIPNVHLAVFIASHGHDVLYHSLAFGVNLFLIKGYQGMPCSHVQLKDTLTV